MMNVDEPETDVIKVCVVGDSSVGKSSISIRFVRDVFYSNIHPTLGVAYLSKVITTEMGRKYKLQIWDTAGQERYRSLVPIYYQSASIILLVFDVTNKDSLVNGALRWMKELQAVGPDDALYALVGNKVEISDVAREVTQEEGRKWASEIGVIYREVSAKSGYNIFELFHYLCTLLDGRRAPPFMHDNSTKKRKPTKVGVICESNLSVRGKVETLKLQYRKKSSSDSRCCSRFCNTS